MLGAVAERLGIPAVAFAKARDEFGLGMDLEMLKDGFDVVVDCVEGETEMRGDLASGVALDEECHGGALTVGKRWQGDAVIIRPALGVKDRHLGEENVSNAVFAWGEKPCRKAPIDAHDGKRGAVQRPEGHDDAVDVRALPKRVGSGFLIVFLRIHLLAESGEVATFLGELCGKQGMHAAHLGVVVSLGERGVGFLGETAVQEADVNRRLGRIHLRGEPPGPAVGINETRDSIHEVPLSSDVITGMGANFAEETDNGAGVGGAEGIGGVFHGLGEERVPSWRQYCMSAEWDVTPKCE